MFGKKRSFHDAGFSLIDPILDIKSMYFITLCGVVVYTIAGSFIKKKK
mgnify:CR=1 FL=1